MGFRCGKPLETPKSKCGVQCHVSWKTSRRNFVAGLAGTVLVATVVGRRTTRRSQTPLYVGRFASRARLERAFDRSRWPQERGSQRNDRSRPRKPPSTTSLALAEGLFTSRRWRISAAKCRVASQRSSHRRERRGHPSHQVGQHRNQAGRRFRLGTTRKSRWSIPKGSMWATAFVCELRIHTMAASTFANARWWLGTQREIQAGPPLARRNFWLRGETTASTLFPMITGERSRSSR